MNGVVPIISAIFLVILILFYNNVVSVVSGAFASIFSPSQAGEITNDAFFKRSCIISFIICIPLFSFCLTTCGISALNFPETTAVMVALFLVRHLSDILLSFLDGNYKVADESRLSNYTFVIITLFSLPALIYSLVSGFANSVFPSIWIGIVSAIFVIVRYLTALRNFLSLKFSPFFTFLYLCGLKFLPIAVAVKVLVN